MNKFLENKEQLEFERTFSFKEDDLNKVLDNINPKCKFIYINSNKFNFKSLDHTFSVHIIYINNDPNIKDRVKYIIDKSGEIIVNVAPKVWLDNEGDSYQSYMERDSKYKLNQGLKSFFKVNNPILCSYIKERLKFTYKGNGEKIKLSIDKIIGFNPVNIDEHGLPFYHIEFESNNIKTVDNYIFSNINRRNLSIYLKPLTNDDLKMSKSKPYCHNDPVLNIFDVCGLQEYILSIKNKLLPIPFYQPNNLLDLI